VIPPQISVVVPARDEPAIGAALDRIVAAVPVPHEVIVVVDRAEDTTRARFAAVAGRLPSCRVVVQTYGDGPANAIRFGIDAATAPVVVITMADGSDEVEQILELTRRVRDGNVIAVASRYAHGGRHIGGPLLKRSLSRCAGLLLHALARVGTRDATNSFKAYDARFLREVGIHSTAGFEIGIELVAKARRLRLPVTEVATSWLDREFGVSNFRLISWFPDYLRWFFFAFGGPMTLEQLRGTLDNRK
jgi:dolichol-phosphate mannosyltransferase